MGFCCIGQVLSMDRQGLQTGLTNLPLIVQLTGINIQPDSLYLSGWPIKYRVGMVYLHLTRCSQ